MVGVEPTTYGLRNLLPLFILVFACLFTSILPHCCPTGELLCIGVARFRSDRVRKCVRSDDWRGGFCSQFKQQESASGKDRDAEPFSQ